MPGNPIDLMTDPSAKPEDPDWVQASEENRTSERTYVLDVKCLDTAKIDAFPWRVLTEDRSNPTMKSDKNLSPHRVRNRKKKNKAARAARRKQRRKCHSKDFK